VVRWVTTAALPSVSKLAKPDALVVAICGDGSNCFHSLPPVHWLARAYQAPFLHVVLNNGGWRAAAPGGRQRASGWIAAAAPNIDIHFPQPPDYSAIAAGGGGAHPEIVRSVAE
jgi:acetolactate synthase-1/2/3 large subunit